VQERPESWFRKQIGIIEVAAFAARAAGRKAAASTATLRPTRIEGGDRSLTWNGDWGARSGVVHSDRECTGQRTSTTRGGEGGQALARLYTAFKVPQRYGGVPSAERTAKSSFGSWKPEMKSCNTNGEIEARLATH
jgi:hypothetical protein